jgi:hypothetical protein
MTMAIVPATPATTLTTLSRESQKELDAGRGRIDGWAAHTVRVRLAIIGPALEVFVLGEEVLMVGLCLSHECQLQTSQHLSTAPFTVRKLVTSCYTQPLRAPS